MNVNGAKKQFYLHNVRGITDETFLQINENGTYDVTDYETVNVNVKQELPTLITYNRIEYKHIYHRTMYDGQRMRATGDLYCLTTRKFYRNVRRLSDIDESMIPCVWYNTVNNVTDTRLVYAVGQSVSLMYYIEEGKSFGPIKNIALINDGSTYYSQTLFYYNLESDDE